MSKPLILSFDLGTTNFKAGLYDRAGELLCLARRPTPVEPGPPRVRELDPANVHATLDDLVDELHDEHAGLFSRIAGVTASFQANSFTLLDDDHQPVMPMVLWNDKRSVETFDPDRDPGRLSGDYQQTGIPRLGPGFLPAKLDWLKKTRPEVMERGRHVAMIADLFSLHVAGERVIEGAAAGLTGLMDIHELWWLERPLRELGLPSDRLPRIGRAGSVVGPVRPQIARRWRLPAHCVHVLGNLDQIAAALGAGNDGPGRPTENTGTVLAVVRLSDRFDPALAAHGVYQGPTWRPGLYYRMLFSETSAGLLEAYRRSLPGPPPIEELDALAAATPPGSHGLRLREDAVPADADWFTDRAQDPALGDHTVGDHTRAIYEGVARTLRRMLLNVNDNQTPFRLTSSGGAAASDTWLTIKGQTVGCAIDACSAPEPAAAGAARLAFNALPQA